MERYGSISIKLKELLDKSGLSKSKLCHRAELQMTQLNNYYNNRVTRLDTDVLARICAALGCDAGELLEYVPPKDEE